MLALEIRQYLGAQEGVQTIVPRLLGQTAKAQKRKATSTPRRGSVTWTEASVLEALPETEAATAAELIRWAREHDLSLKHGGGPKEGNVRFHVPLDDEEIYVGAILTNGRFYIGLQVLEEVAPFSDDGALDELIARYHRIAGFRIPPRKRRGWRPVPLALLTDPANRQAFFEALTYHVEEIRRANA